MANVLPSRDGLLNVSKLLLTLGTGKPDDNIGILKSVNLIFNYNGPRTTEVDALVSQIRATFQDVNTCIASI